MFFCVCVERLFPISPKRMRFSLSQLYVCTPNVVQARRVETIEQAMPLVAGDFVIPGCQKDHATVRGLFLHQKESPTENTIFWVYGGAYLAGDALGNSSAADWVAKETGMDVFCPEFRLAPDGDIEDVFWDAALAYKWLLSKRKDPSKIFFLGISSGAAICIRLMQMIADQQRGETTLPDYIPNLGSQPKGAVLFGPYIDYTNPKKGSFLHYPRVDLVVNESVQNYGLPYLDNFIPDGRRQEYSPVYRSMKGLPPVCVVVSEHEAVYDMTMEFVNRARTEGVHVTVGVWKYMCHVFSFFWGFVPEGRQSMEFACNWLQQEAR
jgi:monoterpene epsilon-lactone hydrolase